MTYLALVFDFFGVVCSEVAPFWLKKYLTESQAEEIKRTVIDAADRGVMSQDALFSALGQLAHVTPEQAEQEWLSEAETGVAARCQNDHRAGGRFVLPRG